MKVLFNKQRKLLKELFNEVLKCYLEEWVINIEEYSANIDREVECAEEHIKHLRQRFESLIK